jgi:hypothetical protein
MDFFALVPERNVLEEVEEAATSGQGAIDEETSVKKRNEKSEEGEKDEKKRKKKPEEGKKRKEEQKQDAKEEGARERKGPGARGKRQKALGDCVPRIIEDDDTTALAKFIADVREPLARAKEEKKKLFLDWCGGAGDVGLRAEARHGRVSVGMDWVRGPIYVDLKKPCVYNYIEKELVEEDLVGGGMLHCPCETWSPARHGRPGDGTPVPLRDRKEHVWGLPGLSVRDQQKLEEGNGIARACLKYRDLLRRNHVPVGLENGDMSMLWAAPEVKEEMHGARVLKVSYCMMGKPFRKTTRLVVWSVKNDAVLSEQADLCRRAYFCASPGGVCRRTGKKHLVLTGWTRKQALTKGAERYPRKFVNVIAKVLCS